MRALIFRLCAPRKMCLVDGENVEITLQLIAKRLVLPAFSPYLDSPQRCNNKRMRRIELLAESASELAFVSSRLTLNKNGGSKCLINPGIGWEGTGKLMRDWLFSEAILSMVRTNRVSHTHTMTAANPRGNCKVRRAVKRSHQPRWSCRLYIRTWRSIPFSLSFSQSFLVPFPMYSRFISLVADNRADAIHAESHRHAGNADVPLCNRSLIVSWLIAPHCDAICIIQGVREKLRRNSSP